MNLGPRLAGFLMCAGLSVGLTGCHTGAVQSREYLGLPKYPATLPNSVKILQMVPSGPHLRLGEITVGPSGNPSKEVIEQQLQQAAGALGANAVVIVFDQTKVLGTTVVGSPWWGGATVIPHTGHVIVGVAIRLIP